MASSTPTSVSNLHIIKAQADFADGMVKLHLKQWLTLHRRRFLLKQCERHKAYFTVPFQVLASLMRHCRCKPIRECVQNVLAVERGLKECEKHMAEWAKREFLHDAAFQEMSL
jgi:hypothetical protein